MGVQRVEMLGLPPSHKLLASGVVEDRTVVPVQGCPGRQFGQAVGTHEKAREKDAGMMEKMIGPAPITDGEIAIHLGVGRETLKRASVALEAVVPHADQQQFRGIVPQYALGEGIEETLQRAAQLRGS